MKSIVCFVTAILGLMASSGVIKASGPVSVYALVDKVTFEPNEDQPQRIRVSGVFITAAERSDVHSAPQRGYLYLSLPKQNEDLAVKEWMDLKSVAGSQQVVAFGSSWYGKVRVRKRDEEAGTSDRYPLGNGMTKVRADHPRAKELLEDKDR
jgi:hypothetical protein